MVVEITTSNRQSLHREVHLQDDVRTVPEEESLSVHADLTLEVTEIRKKVILSPDNFIGNDKQIVLLESDSVDNESSIDCLALTSTP